MLNQEGYRDWADMKTLLWRCEKITNGGIIKWQGCLIIIYCAVLFFFRGLQLCEFRLPEQTSGSDCGGGKNNQGCGNSHATFAIVLTWQYLFKGEIEQGSWHWLIEKQRIFPGETHRGREKQPWCEMDSRQVCDKRSSSLSKLRKDDPEAGRERMACEHRQTHRHWNTQYPAP